MPRFAEVEGFPEPLEFPDTTTDEVMDSAVRQAVQEHARKQTEAGGARKSARQELADQARQAAQTGVTPPNGMGTGEIVPPGGSQGPTAGPSEVRPGLIPGVTDIPFLMEEEGAGAVMDPAREAAARHLPGIIGGTAGGLAGGPLGARAGAMVGPVAGRVAGAGASLLARMLAGATGTGAGEAVGAGMAGEDPVPAAEKGALWGLLGEAGGAVAAKVIPKVLAPMRGKLLPEAMEAAYVLEPMGARLTPAQMTSSRALDIMENVAKGGLFGGEAIPRQRAHAIDVAQDLMRQYRLNFPEKASPVVRGLYDTAKQELRGVTVDLTETYQMAKALAAQAKGRSPAIAKLKNWVHKLGQEVEVPQEGLIPGFEVFGEPATRTIRVFEHTPFEEAVRLRSDLLAITRQIPTELASGKAHGVSRKIVAGLHEAMDTAAQGAGPRAHGAWRLADETYKQAKFGNFVEGLMKKGMDAEGNISGKAILMTLNRTPQTRLDIFSPANVEDLRDFAKILEFTQRADKEGIGKVWIQLIQGGIATGAFAKGMSPEAAVVLAGPRILSWAMTNPKTAKWLTTGFAKPGTEESARAIGMLIGQMSGRGITGTREAEAGGLYETLGVSP